MAKPKIAVFSGPNSTIANSPTLVTSNKGRLPGEKMLDGRYDHLAPQLIHEPVMVRISKFSGHPLEEDGRAVYHDDGRDYYEVELRPEDGPYLLPYMARRRNGGETGTPFEDADLYSEALQQGGRQFFYPDASRMFAEIDRTLSGRDEHGVGSVLDRRADFDFIRALPPGGYTEKGERAGVDFFPYKPSRYGTRVQDIAKAANVVAANLASGNYAGCIWLEGSPAVEETIYWLSLLIDTNLPMAGNAAQRTHGQLANDGDRNIVDAVDFIISGEGIGIGAVGVQDERIFAAREFKKADDRPGNYKATGGHGGVLGTVGPPVTVWYVPNYKHTAKSDVNLSRLPQVLEFPDGQGGTVHLAVKDNAGDLRGEIIPRVHIVKYGNYQEEDETGNPDHEVDILARINKAQEQQGDGNGDTPKLHGLVMEGSSPYGQGSRSQMAALEVATFSGLPVVRVGRADTGGRVPSDDTDVFIEGSNLDTNKARLLLMASMMKLGRMPAARDPRNPTAAEHKAVMAKVEQYQEIFETH